jgi:hypothetical protein
MSVEETPGRSYKAWVSMRRLNAASEICARWDQFESFFSDMGKRPRGMTLVRIDERAAYAPDNCHWKMKKVRSDAVGLTTAADDLRRIKELRDAGHTPRNCGAVTHDSHGRARCLSGRQIRDLAPLWPPSGDVFFSVLGRIPEIWHTG